MGPAVQPERTALAWQRTALSLLAAAGVMARFGFDRLGAWALAPLVFAVPVTVWVLGFGRRADEHGRYRLQDTGAPLVFTCLISVLGVAALAHVLAGA